MLLRFLEHCLIAAFNRTADRKAVSAPATPEPQEISAPDDQTVIGHTIVPEGKSQLVRLSAEARLRHIYILGATGSGKTNLTMRLIEADLRQGRPLCVFDLRGDLIDRILVRIAAQGEVEKWKKRLLLLDLRSPDSFVGANPLAGEGDTYSRAMHLLSVPRRSRTPGGCNSRRRFATA